MNNLTVTKKFVELDVPLRVNYISLNYATLYDNIYNVSKRLVYTDSKRTRINIDPGYYTLEQLKSKMSNELILNENTLEVSHAGRLTDSEGLIKDKMIYLSPLCLYLYVEGIDTSKNYFNGKRSSLLTAIPLGTRDIGSIVTFQPTANIFKKMYDGEINQLSVKILDENEKEYTGKFTLEFTLK